MQKNLDYYMKLPYTFIIRPDKDNGGKIVYVARVLEIPHIIGDGNTPEKAIGTLNIHMRMAIESLLEDDLPVPEPQTEYSGNINLRVDPELHAGLAQEAAAFDMSLNKYSSLILERRQRALKETTPTVIRETKRRYKAKK